MPSEGSRDMRRGMVCALLVVAATEAAAQAAFDGVAPELCLSLEADPATALADAGAEPADALLSQLVVTALLRHCAATGVIAPPELPRADPTRAIDEDIEGALDERDILAAEAEYYLSIAMGVDADAANDLLRRLLGSTPENGSRNE
jgi:hypothetical protein